MAQRVILAISKLPLALNFSHLDQCPNLLRWKCRELDPINPLHGEDPPRGKVEVGSGNDHIRCLELTLVKKLIGR